MEGGREAVSKRQKKSFKKPDPEVIQYEAIGRGVCAECGGEFFKVIIWHGGNWVIQCSGCKEPWIGQV